MRRLLLGLVVAVATLIPNLAMANDQAIARHIMSKLQLEQQRGALKGFHVDMRVDQGTVWYQGFVSEQSQKDLILKTAQRAKHLGVVQVVDDITVRTADAQPVAHSVLTEPPAPALAQTAYQEIATPQEITTPAQAQPQIQTPAQAAIQSQPLTPQIQARPNQIQAQGISNRRMIQAQGTPMPLAQNAASAMPVSGDQAALPAYAWPSYAAHPNYGAVTYPGQYSASAWPYIGPFYPYPQVPLGWRKVTLEWDDGWWWLDFHNR